MSDELREAAEKAAHDILTCSLMQPDFWEKRVACAEVIRRLLDSTADDEEPVTVEWLRKSGANERKETVSLSRGLKKKRAERSYVRFVFISSCGESLSFVGERDIWSAIAGGFDFPDPGVTLPMQKTRGDVRRLCRALGITLKEVGP